MECTEWRLTLDRHMEVLEISKLTKYRCYSCGGMNNLCLSFFTFVFSKIESEVISGE